MTNDEFIEMAKQAGFLVEDGLVGYKRLDGAFCSYTEILNKFTHLVSANATKSTPKNHSCGYEKCWHGTHAGNVNLVAPDWLKESYPNGVCIDVCIALEITNLWNAGVKTLNSCCGHGATAASIVVADESINEMIELGYQLDPNYPNRSDIFLAKTNLDAITSMQTDKLENERFHHALSSAVGILSLKISELDNYKNTEIGKALKGVQDEFDVHRQYCINKLNGNPAPVTSMQVDSELTREEIIAIAEKAGAYVGNNYPQLIEGNHQVKVFEYTKKVIDLARSSDPVQRIAQEQADYITKLVLEKHYMNKTIFDKLDKILDKAIARKETGVALADVLILRNQFIDDEITPHPAPVTSMQGDGEPVATVHCRNGEWFGYIPVKVLKEQRVKIGDKLYLHGRVKGVSDSTADYINRIEELSEQLNNHDLAKSLIDAWCAEHNSQISWGKAIEIVAIVTKMPPLERSRLLTLDEPNIQAELEQLRSQLSTNTDGWVSVPIEPTPKMLVALWQHREAMRGESENKIAGVAYKAMINAISQDKGESM